MKRIDWVAELLDVTGEVVDRMVGPWQDALEGTVRLLPSSRGLYTLRIRCFPGSPLNPTNKEARMTGHEFWIPEGARATVEITPLIRLHVGNSSDSEGEEWKNEM